MARASGLAIGPFAVVLMMCLIVGSAGSTEAVEEKKESIWSTVPFFNWIVDTDASADQFTFFINGVQAAGTKVSAVKHQESLHVRFPLAYEVETTIEVRRQGESLFRATLFYAPSYENRIVPDNATYLPFHTEEREKPCRKCHRLEVKPFDNEPPEVKKQLCYPCHSHKFEGSKSQHRFIVSQWRCLQCHQDEAKASKRNPGQPLRFTIDNAAKIDSLCFRCHKKFAERLKEYPRLHGPIGMGVCTQCHNPHASTYPKLQQNNTSTLCINCHEMAEELKKPIVHEVIKSKGCTACHPPHGGYYPKLLRDTVNNQCLSCHEAIAKQANNHPVQGHPVFIKGRDQEKKDTLNCVSCHSPHAAEFPSLLPEAEMMMLCTHCHPMGTK